MSLSVFIDKKNPIIVLLCQNLKNVANLCFYIEVEPSFSYFTTQITFNPKQTFLNSIRVVNAYFTEEFFLTS